MPRYFKQRQHAEKPTAWVFCGVSSKAQAKKDKVSLDVQEREGRALCASRGWEVTAVLKADYTRSGTDFNLTADEMLAQKPAITAYDELRKAMRQMSYAPDYIVYYTGDRLGRSQSILTYIIETLVRRGTFFYALHDGKDIDKENFRGYISRVGEKAASGVDELVMRRRNTMLEYVARGIPTSSHIPFTHERVRDPKTGQTIGMRVNAKARLLMHDAADLLLQGIGWPTMGRLLKERYGHTDLNGSPLTKLKIRFGFLSPQCWGHNAMNYRGHEMGYGLDLWVLGPGEVVSPPPETTIAYNVVEPVFTGELAERVKAELRRRRMVERGKSRPDKTYFLRGLYVCGECGRLMSIQRRKYTNWCVSTYCGRKAETKVYGLGKPCTQRRWIHDRKVRAFTREIVALYIADGLPQRPAPPAAEDVDAIEAEVSDLSARLQRLVNLQGMADNSEAQQAYANEIRAVSQLLGSARRRINEVRVQTASAPHVRMDDAALAEIREKGEAWLWDQPDYAINQFLHKLFGEARIVAKDGELFFSPPDTAI